MKFLVSGRHVDETFTELIDGYETPEDIATTVLTNRPAAGVPDFVVIREWDGTNNPKTLKAVLPTPRGRR